MENRGRASHIWKFFQTSCKGYTWQCCCFWLFYSLWKEMWADLAIHEQEKVIELCISIQSSVMCLYALTWNYTRYLSWSRLKEVILHFTPYKHLHGATQSLISGAFLMLCRDVQFWGLQKWALVFTVPPFGLRSFSWNFTLFVSFLFSKTCIMWFSLTLSAP